MKPPINQGLKEIPPGRLELPAQGLGIPCSIRLSYGGIMYVRGLRGGPFVLDSASLHIRVQLADRLMQTLVVDAECWSRGHGED